MPRSPFEIAFDHIAECEACDFAERRLCPDGRALFNAAHDACKLLASDDAPQAKGQA